MSKDGIELKLKGATFKTDFSQLFSSVLVAIAHAVAAAKTGGVSLAFAPNAISGFFGGLKSFKGEETPEVKAWLLVSGGLLFAIEKVLNEYLDQKSNLLATTLQDFSTNLAERVATREYVIQPDFFLHPNRISLLDDASHELSASVSSLGGTALPATLRGKLEKHFPAGLHRTWMKNPNKFEPLEAALNTPFAKSLRFTNEVDGYLQYIEEQFTQIRLIGQDEDDPEAVRLAQVFVPLRAYIEHPPPEHTNTERVDPEALGIAEVNAKREVISLFESLDGWIKSPKRRDWLRVISGGPGIGKSSSMRAYAAKIAKEEKAYPIVIPLQKLERPLNALRERIGYYLTTHKDIPFTSSPLDGENSLRQTVLLIFDGLDELVRPGRDADEIARDFMSDLQRLLDEENGRGATSAPTFLAMVTGRIAAASSAAKALKCSPDQVLFLLPFNVREPSLFFDPLKLLKQDQRRTWWDLWKSAANDVPEKLPEGLLSRDLFEVTIEPLLLYFIAFVRPWEASSEGSIDRNSLYDLLLRNFYRRECDKGDRNFATEFEEFSSYEVVLQAMAFAAWYDGSTRTGTIDTVFKLLRSWDEDIANAFENIVSANKPAVGAALAFYMKPGERPNSFEFLHKTFAEYLVARRMLETVRYFHDAYFDWQEAQTRRRAFDESMYLLEWLRLIGPREIDSDVLVFLRAELLTHYLHNKEQTKAWQKTLTFFLQACVANRIPAHLLFTLPDEKCILRPQTFLEAVEQERNAEIAMLACLNSTILAEIDEPGFTAIDIQQGRKGNLAQFIDRIRGRRTGPINFGLGLLAGIDMSDELFHIVDFYRADLRKANFENCDLTYCIFASAVLSRANLRGADLTLANLEAAHLVGANCENARFVDANMTRSSLNQANVRHTNFAKAALSRADLSGLDLTSANLVDTNLTGANLKRAKITPSQLKKVKIPPKIGRGSRKTQVKKAEKRA